MALTGRRHVHLVRPFLLGGHSHRAVETILFDPWFGNPLSPKRADAGRPVRPAARDPRPRRPLRRRADDREPDAPGLAVHPRDEPLARPELRPQGHPRRVQQGRHDRGGRDQGHDGPGGALVRRAVRRSRVADLPGRAGRLHRGAGGRVPDLLRGRHGRVRRHEADRRAVPSSDRLPADRRALHDGSRPPRRSPSSCSA